MSKIHARSEFQRGKTLCGRPMFEVANVTASTGSYRPVVETREKFCRVCFPITRRSK